VPRIGCQVVRLLLLAELLGAGFGLAQSPSALSPPSSAKPGSAKPNSAKPNSAPSNSVALLGSVRVMNDAQGLAVEIVTTSKSDQAPNPIVQTLESPPRLVIDLPDTRVLLPRKPLAVNTAQVSR